ncbi:Stk1 family PASTA domain-containing Ser/Thr kinase [Actinopolymorpha sp. B9G3]|uniref:Stk1 family PASTA domain-containing Ser/Thr kinase n=1 Tax=Actinopolymorpha sp. B9G3 TaxID=3158970 RepID=UPI0032D8EF3C
MPRQGPAAAVPGHAVTGRGRAPWRGALRTADDRTVSMVGRHQAEGYPTAVTEPGVAQHLVHGRYEVGEVIGRGGMAEVRIGVDRRLGRTVAVKTLRADHATDPTFQARFRREAQSAAGLNHPSIVAVYDTAEEVLEGVSVPYIVMEYVEGRTLREVVREGRRVLPERALEITADICDALEYSHRAGIVHRDIKPANVMLTADGDVKVMDFGIARAVSTATQTAAMTQTGAVMGTAQYLSPEQVHGQSVDARSDIYSTGCLLYELLTGQPPFVGDSPVSVAYQHVQQDARPPSTLAPHLPAVVDAITLTALQKDPGDRYQSAAQMRLDIERGLSGQQVAAPVMPIDATAPFMAGDDSMTLVGDRPDRRGRGAGYALLALALLLLLGVAAFIGLRALGQQEPRTALVPTLMDKTEREARAILGRNNLDLAQVTTKPSDSVPKGRIIAQDPDPGMPIKAGGTVGITVSDGKPRVTITDVTGKQLAEAKAQLVAKGFKVKQHEDDESTELNGTVTRSDPAAGTQATAGTTITLFYSTGLVEVPDVMRESQEVAEARLADAGFDVRTTHEPTADAPTSTVINQTPTAGTRRERGSTITIVVASQPELEPEPTPTPTDDDGGILDDLF